MISPGRPKHRLNARAGSTKLAQRLTRQSRRLCDRRDRAASRFRKRSPAACSLSALSRARGVADEMPVRQRRQVCISRREPAERGSSTPQAVISAAVARYRWCSSAEPRREEPRVDRFVSELLSERCLPWRSPRYGVLAIFVPAVRASLVYGDCHLSAAVTKIRLWLAGNLLLIPRPGIARLIEKYMPLCRTGRVCGGDCGDSQAQMRDPPA
jgi:hypothetical protein